MNRTWWCGMLAAIPVILGCPSATDRPALPKQVTTLPKEPGMRLTSSALRDSEFFDRQYTADGADISPPLAWSAVPSGTHSLALICEDPDAPNPARPAAEPWVHWVLYNIPVEPGGLPAGVERREQPREVAGARQGRNSWPRDNMGYRGPAPPPGSGVHRYVFTLYALDALLDLPAGASKQQLIEAMSGHQLATGTLTGTYSRPK